jgi:hypothetical protein
MFQGKGELDQIKKIFALLGTPTQVRIDCSTCWACLTTGCGQPARHVDLMVPPVLYGA